MNVSEQIFMNLIMIVFLASFVVDAGTTSPAIKEKLTSFSILSALIWAVAPVVGPALPLLLQVLLMLATYFGARKTG
jgi:hypothetical protein